MKPAMLLVDDDPILRGVAAHALRSYGALEVVEASDGLEALEIYKTRKEEICICITDVTMPKMDGLQLLEKLKAIKPDLPVIIITGESGRGLPEGTLVVKKPFRQKDLAQLAYATVFDYTNGDVPTICVHGDGKQ